MKVNFQNNSLEKSWASYKKYLEPILTKTLEVTKNATNVEVGVILMDSKAIHEYNRDYRNVDRPTDVLSFVDGENIDGVIYLGDILINVEALRDQAKEYGHSLKREFCFLVVHGYLHLLGYDHHTPEEEKEMTELQEEVLYEIAPRRT